MNCLSTLLFYFKAKQTINEHLGKISNYMDIFEGVVAKLEPNDVIDLYRAAVSSSASLELNQKYLHFFPLLTTIRGGLGSVVPESTPAELCVLHISDPDPKPLFIFGSIRSLRGH